MQYKNKSALVTGASGGLGTGIAKELARRGAHVLLVARNWDRLQEVAGQIREDGGQATPIVCDVTIQGSIETLAVEVKGSFQQLDLLINNAGKEMLLPLQLTELDAARDLIEVNVLALASITKAFLRLLKRGSTIVNISSVAGQKGAPGMSIYAASKGAVSAMTRSLALELAPRGVRVNAVAAGMVKSPLLDRMLAKLKPEQVSGLEARHPLGFGTVEDVAAAVAFLGSDDAQWITGHVMVVDGGFTA
ncbi:SDR family NAD(P)-dependent oxidoreductase [Bacteroidota bacterium]